MALSGGGFKGLFTATVLEGLEDAFGCPIAQKFDLLAGTSIGGIIALALAAEIPAKDIKSTFLEKGGAIFAKPRKTLGLGFHSKYDSQGLRQCLKDFFGDSKIGELKHRVIIPTVNYTTGQPQVYKTRHHMTFSKDIKLPIVDVGLATSAAPTYYPISRTNQGDFVDGGLVANHPGLFACIEAWKFLDVQFKDIMQLHIGTISQKITSPGIQKIYENGFLKWRKRLFEITLSCQEQSAELMTKFLIGGDNYHSINMEVSSEQKGFIGLDKTSPHSRRLLQQNGDDCLKKFLGNSFAERIKSYTTELFTQIPLN